MGARVGRRYFEPSRVKQIRWISSGPVYLCWSGEWEWVREVHVCSDVDAMDFMHAAVFPWHCYGEYWKPIKIENLGGAGEVGATLYRVILVRHQERIDPTSGPQGQVGSHGPYLEREEPAGVRRTAR